MQTWARRRSCARGPRSNCRDDDCSHFSQCNAARFVGPRERLCKIIEPMHDEKPSSATRDVLTGACLEVVLAPAVLCRTTVPPIVKELESIRKHVTVDERLRLGR